MNREAGGFVNRAGKLSQVNCFALDILFEVKSCLEGTRLKEQSFR